MAGLVAIVDDDQSVREATSGLVRSLGYRAAAFASAEAFLASGRAGDTACLITDVNMPGMSGPALQNHLAAAGGAPPIVFISAFPDEAVRRRLLAAGALAYLEKPYREESLIGCLEFAFGRGRQRQE